MASIHWVNGKNPEKWDLNVITKEVNKQNGILKCGSVTDEDRDQIFRGFWSDMNWEQRRVYVVGLVDVAGAQQKRGMSDNSRRLYSYKCHLVTQSGRVRVCKEMFLSTQNIGEWSLRDWTLLLSYVCRGSPLPVVSTPPLTLCSFLYSSQILTSFFFIGEPSDFDSI